MEEFLNSSVLAPNSRKVYERELRRFLTWTELLWGEIKPRHVAQYKALLDGRSEDRQRSAFV
jgi:integrase/recombinase XerD